MAAANIERPTEREDRAARLAALVGKRILVGITLLDAGGTVIEHRQLSGMIVAATIEDGIDIDQDENVGLFNLPPDPDAVYPAPPGHYRLRATGRIVIDPDLHSTWNFQQRLNG